MLVHPSAQDPSIDDVVNIASSELPTRCKLNQTPAACQSRHCSLGVYSDEQYAISPRLCTTMASYLRAGAPAQDMIVDCEPLSTTSRMAAAHKASKAAPSLQNARCCS
jgi:hypothetical protein